MIGKQTEPDTATQVTAFKYLWRWWAKGGKDDLDKAIDCLERLKGEIDEQR